MKKNINIPLPVCPNCKKNIYFSFDEFGFTPYHLHCKNCKINIGSRSDTKCMELFKKYHKPDTYLEYYSNDIQLLIEEGKFKINKEKLIKND